MERLEGQRDAGQLQERKAFRKWLYLFPLGSLLLVLAAGTGGYLFQQHKTKQANNLLRSGEELALAGKYADAQEQVRQGLELRPGNTVLIDDQKILTDVLMLDSSLQTAVKAANARQYDQAIKDIHLLQKMIEGRSGLIYKKLAAQAGGKEEEFVVSKVKERLGSSKTVNDLLPLLDTLKPYGGEAAKASVKNVKQKIVDISYEQSSTALQSRNFEKALSIVANALKQDEKNAKLLGLQKTIQQKQKAFAEAEQQRIPKAIEASTKEDMNDRTNGAQLLSIHAELDDYGYFKVGGEIKNIATRPISSVTVYCDLLDSYGNVLYHVTMYALPYYLAIGEKGSFSNSYYYDGDMASATVTRLEWQLE